MGKKKAPSAPKVAKVVSPFKNVKNYELNLEGFGTGYAGINGDKQTSSSSLAPGLQQANMTAQEGLNNNLQYLNQSPDVVYQNLLAGGNSYYNQGKLQLDRSLNQALSNADARFAANGLDNSTTRGAMMSTQLSDANLRDAALQNEALNFLNARALGNMQANQGLIGGLAGIGGQLAQGAQNQFQYGVGTDVAVAQANAQAQNQANMAAYQQAVAEANKPGVWGTLANIGGTLVGAALGGPIGAQLGSAAGRSIGNLFGGSGGGAAASVGSARLPSIASYQAAQPQPNYLSGSWGLS